MGQSLTKTVSRPRIIPGTNATFIITVKNGSRSAYSVNLSDQMGSSVTFVSWTQTSPRPPTWTLTAPPVGTSAPLVTAHTDCFPAGQTSTFQLVVFVKPHATSFSLSNSIQGTGVRCTPSAAAVAAVVSAASTAVTAVAAPAAAPDLKTDGSKDAEDPHLVQQEASVEVPIIPQADLVTTLTGPKSIDLAKKETAKYQLSLENKGPSHASNVTLKDILPRDVEIVSWKQKSGSDFTLSSSKTNVVAFIPSLAVDSKATFELELRPLKRTKCFVNTAAVSSTTFDPELSNTVAQVRSQVVCSRK